MTLNTELGICLYYPQKCVRFEYFPDSPNKYQCAECDANHTLSKENQVLNDSYRQAECLITAIPTNTMIDCSTPGPKVISVDLDGPGKIDNFCYDVRAKIDDNCIFSLDETDCQFCKVGFGISGG